MGDEVPNEELTARSWGVGFRGLEFRVCVYEQQK